MTNKGNKTKLREQEYEQLMSNILFLMIHSLYNYNEICEQLHIYNDKFKSMIDNAAYIKEHFGIQMLEKLENSREIRRNLVSDRSSGPSTNEIVKDPKYRQLIKPNVIKVSKYEHELIKRVSVFLENDGNSTKAAINSEYKLNELLTSLNDEKLKNLLLENVYNKLHEFLEIDSILTQNRISECKNLIKTVILATYEEKGNLKRIEEKTGYSEIVIRRILEHPYFHIICNNLDINISLDMLHYEEETIDNYYPIPYYDELGKLVEIAEQEAKLVLDIADYMIENNASYSKAAQKFNLSKKTICVKMKEKLPYISKSKSEEVNEIVEQHTSKSVKDDKSLQERVLFESEIFLRGYTLNEVAYLVNGSYSAIQRDLSKRLPQISEEKGQLVKTKLQYNQAYKNQ